MVCAKIRIFDEIITAWVEKLIKSDQIILKKKEGNKTVFCQCTLPSVLYIILNHLKQNALDLFRVFGEFGQSVFDGLFGFADGEVDGG